MRLVKCGGGNHGGIISAEFDNWAEQGSFERFS
jgi:hypothetical protein